MPDKSEPTSGADQIDLLKWSAAEVLGESDRSAAIVGSAVLDEIVRTTLFEVFYSQGKHAAHLLGSEDTAGELGFLNKCRLAHCLGLVGDESFNDLKRIAQIRNRFAHGPLKLSFDDEPIKQMCSELKAPEALDDSPSDAKKDTTRSVSPRDRFIIATLHLGAGLLIEMGHKLQNPLDGPSRLE